MEITDYIQEQAGQSAEVIWGYGPDESLEADLCVTVIATGFKSQEVDNALGLAVREQRRMQLNPNAGREVTGQQVSPTRSAPDVKPQAAPEPFLKSEEPQVAEQPEEMTFNIQPLEAPQPPVEDELEDMVLMRAEPETPESKDNEAEASAPDLFAQMTGQADALKMEVESPAAPEQPTLGERFTLDDSIENEDLTRETDALKFTEVPARDNHVVEDRPPREELAARNKEREQRIREFTVKLKTPNGLSDLENEPAYRRREIQLDNTPHSADSSVSRYTLSEEQDEDGNKKINLKGNNPFLHDNVD
jgi:cell division protein FtsZ